MKIYLFAICKNDRFIKLMEQLFNMENIVISGICKDVSRGYIEYINSNPVPDIVLLDAYWPGGTCKELLKQLLSAKTKVILATNYLEENILDNFLPLQPHGYIFRTCDDYKIITDCIGRVFAGKKCSV